MMLGVQVSLKLSFFYHILGIKSPNEPVEIGRNVFVSTNVEQGAVLCFIPPASSRSLENQSGTMTKVACCMQSLLAQSVCAG